MVYTCEVKETMDDSFPPRPTNTSLPLTEPWAKLRPCNPDVEAAHAQDEHGKEVKHNMSITYIITILISSAIGGLATWYVRSTLKKYREVPTETGLTGAQIAKNMMQRYGIENVPVRKGRRNQNHFNPRTNSITLDPHAHSSSSVTAIATGCHEVGHACQFAQGYFPMKLRRALVPIVNFTQNSWLLIMVIGFLLQVAGLVYLAIGFYAVSVLFHLVTLPVEFDASRRGLEYLTETGVGEEEKAGAQAVLRACALTYVAAALVSIVGLISLIIRRAGKIKR